MGNQKSKLKDFERACHTRNIDEIDAWLKSDKLTVEKLNTGLQEACEEGYTDIVKLLIKDREKYDRFRPIREAAYKGNLELVKLLLENGGDITAAIFGACEGNSRCVFEFLEKEMELSYVELSSGFCGACRGGHIDLAIRMWGKVKQKLQEEEKIGMKWNLTAELNSALIHACDETANVRIIQFLIEEGATNLDGALYFLLKRRPPFILTCKEKRNIENFISYFIDQGANEWREKLNEYPYNKYSDYFNSVLKVERLLNE